MAKRDLLYGQKRPTIWPKETYYKRLTKGQRGHMAKHGTAKRAAPAHKHRARRADRADRADRREGNCTSEHIREHTLLRTYSREHVLLRI